VRSYRDDNDVCQFLVKGDTAKKNPTEKWKAFGTERLVEELRPEDFAKLHAGMEKRWGPVRLANAITRIKSVFKLAVENDQITKAGRCELREEVPVTYGCCGQREPV
jgi:hypothetical protein